MFEISRRRFEAGACAYRLPVRSWFSRVAIRLRLSKITDTSGSGSESARPAGTQ